MKFNSRRRYVTHTECSAGVGDLLSIRVKAVYLDGPLVGDIPCDALVTREGQ